MKKWEKEIIKRKRYGGSRQRKLEAPQPVFRQGRPGGARAWSLYGDLSRQATARFKNVSHSVEVAMRIVDKAKKETTGMFSGGPYGASQGGHHAAKQVYDSLDQALQALEEAARHAANAVRLAQKSEVP